MMLIESCNMVHFFAHCYKQDIWSSALWREALRGDRSNFPFVRITNHLNQTIHWPSPGPEQAGQPTPLDHVKPVQPAFHP